MLFARNVRRGSAAAPAARKAAARAVAEPVEPRQHLDGTFANAVALGPVNGLVVKLDKVNTTDNRNDYFKFTVPQAGRLRVTVNSSSGGGADADLFVYNGPSTGQLLGASLNPGSSEVVDRSLVPAGTYYARVSQAGIATANYTLAVQTDFAGQTPGTARAVGTVNATEKTFKDFVGNTDPQDYYKFNTSANGLISLKLDGLSNDADLELYAANGTTLVKKSAKAGTTPELIYHGSAAGTYYARVFQYNNTSNYTLHLRNAPLPTDQAGGTLATAKDLKTLGTFATDDAITNKFDEADLYKFFVAEKGDITVSLSGLAADLDVELLDNNGNVTASSTAGGTNNDTITKLSNFGGTYYVRVKQGTTVGANGDASPYHLTISAPTDAGPNTKAAAKQLTFVNKQATVAGFVGANDKEDWYKVTVAAGKALTATLTGLTGDADLQLVTSAGTVLGSSAHGGTAGELVTGTNLAAGTYFLRVFSFNALNANYSLKVATT